MRVRQANIFYKNAAAAMARGAWARALEFVRLTLQADPNHRGAANIRQELSSKAKETYLQAYSLKDDDPEKCVSLFREVIAMTPSDDELHQKAMIWLEKLEAGSKAHH